MYGYFYDLVIEMIDQPKDTDIMTYYFVGIKEWNFDENDKKISPKSYHVVEKTVNRHLDTYGMKAVRAMVERSNDSFINREDAEAEANKLNNQS